MQSTHDKWFYAINDKINGEILQKGSQSSLPSSVNTCESWASANNMKLNASKTNEIRMNFSVRSHSYPSVLINDQTVGVVDYVNQLLGVIISNDLKRNLHVNDICKKASKRLYACDSWKEVGCLTPYLWMYTAHVSSLFMNMHVRCDITASLRTSVNK